MYNIKKIRPLNNQIVTTMDLYDEESAKIGSIIDAAKLNNAVKEIQKVVAVGPLVRNIEVGDIVVINPKRYAVKKYPEGSLKDNVITHNEIVRFDFPTIELDKVPHLLIYDSDIDFIIEEFEEEIEPKKLIEVPEKHLIV